MTEVNTVHLPSVEDKVITSDYAHLAQKLDPSDIKDAAKADAAEHQATLWEAFQVNKKAILWSMALSGA